uniref:Uncharacterized protein n=1 Tax=Arundo donax TaxID=35708 RepID=A0A0A9EK41_ARUDO
MSHLDNLIRNRINGHRLQMQCIDK